MGRKIEVPITPSVLEWAIRESGYTLAEVSEGIDGGEDTVAGWMQNPARRPSITELKLIAQKVHRQLATFLLPEPPSTETISVQFRHPLRGTARPLNPTERRYIRRALRLQTAHSWLLRELGRTTPRLPAASLELPPPKFAEVMRSLLGVTLDEQRNWRSASAAFDVWRESVEKLGVVVLLFPMGEESCRGFSLSDEMAPVIAINTRWRDEARIFTLFHELGHLATRTDSACALTSASTGHATEPAERWCEAFAANVIVPESAVTALPKVDDLRQLSRLAGSFKVSLRALALALIDQGKATWALYRAISPHADNKKDGGGGAGRNRREIRADELGGRGASVFIEAVRREVITESQALDYLDIPTAEFAQLAASISAP